MAAESPLCTANLTEMQTTSEQGTSNLMLGSTCALLAGMLLALSMTNQRYALSYPAYRVPFLLCNLPRPAVWWTGFACYFVANMLFAFGSTLTPLSLNATLFTLLLVWNLGFARYFLGEALTKLRVIGAVVIVIGAGVSVLGVPVDAINTFGVNDIGRLANAADGATYMALQVGSGLCLAVSVLWFEYTYALSDEQTEHRAMKQKALATTIVLDSINPLHARK